ncbi:hypothetical protein BOX15_Mlig031326g1 [Macrostomum lignano]|uniref:Nuclease HARBI1 n=1 Tax=Macrostomum lignano TaxID=282301 RepID=A0A267FWT2_9PLAT|nr:hypothetical protein BOX15_Mlig031326g1 [Macrostomum lignano]
MFSDSEEEDALLNEAYAVRIFKERINFQPHCIDFVEKFRLSSDQVEDLLEIIGPALTHATVRQGSLTVREQLLSTLRFLACGSFYHAVGDAHGVSKATLCRTVRRVVTALNNRLFDELVRWPECNQKRAQIAQDFYRVGGMPCVAGCVDVTLIKIRAPVTDEDQFVDRHGNHSINFMVVAGPQLQAFSVCALAWETQ